MRTVGRDGIRRAATSSRRPEVFAVDGEAYAVVGDSADNAGDSGNAVGALLAGGSPR